LVLPFSVSYNTLGDKLNEGDLLAEVKTDKATMGFKTPEEGYLAKILIPGGTKNVAIGKLVCIIVSDESSVAAFKDFKDQETSDVTPPSAASTPPAQVRNLSIVLLRDIEITFIRLFTRKNSNYRNYLVLYNQSLYRLEIEKVLFYKECKGFWIVRIGDI
jgi:Pyruvate/2-oxoglutarate dehydrogenase complex, dihydrolipoamide acyltransferase (E2) component, and related enzymes